MASNLIDLDLSNLGSLNEEVRSLFPSLVKSLTGSRSPPPLHLLQICWGC